MKLIPTAFKTSLFISTFPFALMYSTHAFSGVDIYCETSAQIQNNEYTACNALPALTPANDNQVNMLLLLSDLGLAKLKFATDTETLWYTSSSTVPFETKALTASAVNLAKNARQPNKALDGSNSEYCNTILNSHQDFIQQVKADKKLSSTERDFLIKARSQLKTCDDHISLITVDPHWSVTARQFASYLNGSIAFYNTNFSTASKIYSALTSADQPWIKETAQYMLIRSNLNATYQTGLGEYGDLDQSKINQQLLKNTYDSISQYLKLYPSGRYAASARGLLRRCYWIGGQQQLLVNEITWQINNPKSPFYNLEMSNLAYEIDRHVFQSPLFKAQYLKDPFLLAVYDLMRMRKPESVEDRVINWNELNSQKAVFKTQPELFQYLQATHLFYVQNKPNEALNYLSNPQVGNSNSYLALSQILLKGRVMEKAGQSANTQQYWENLLTKAKTPEQRGLFELMLYPYYVKQQNASFFAGENSKIKARFLQRNFITEQANENSLMHIVQDKSASEDQKNLALNTVLEKSLIHQNYALFNQAYTLLPKNAAQYVFNDTDYMSYKKQPPLGNFVWKGSTINQKLSCPDLYSLTQKLQVAPKDLSLKLCLGEYIRSDKAYRLSSITDDEKQRSTLQGPIFARGQVYKDIIKSTSNADLKAYALYRAIMCYSPGGLNDCQDADVAKSIRKQWFDQIKRDYPETSWAKSLKYYW
ncbi:hypothetical protein [Acinetobacter cumulans]|uniref:hypothetical protein n=1 Tax=Acinetobacter cumulans TaxID=2136182 RepID=UPI00148E7C90|nr:hypothetical protein [Acinetobacter cumulans]